MNRVAEPLVERRNLCADLGVEIGKALKASGVLEGARPASQYAVDLGQGLDVTLNALDLGKIASQGTRDPLLSFGDLHRDIRHELFSRGARRGI